MLVTPETATNPLFVDALDFDQDGQAQVSAQDTDGRRSADFTVRLVSTTADPLTQIVWSLEEDRASSGAPEGWAFTMEACSVLREPSIAIVKSVSSIDDTNGSEVMDAGDTITFTFTAENTGGTSLAEVEVTDAGLSPITLTADPGFDGDLAAGEGPVVVATATYILTAVDVANGAIDNTATGSGVPVATDAFGDP